MSAKQFIMAAALSFAIAASATGAARADAALEECLQHPICKRLMENAKTPEAQAKLAYVYGLAECGNEIE